MYPSKAAHVYVSIHIYSITHYPPTFTVLAWPLAAATTAETATAETIMTAILSWTVELKCKLTTPESAYAFP